MNGELLARIDHAEATSWRLRLEAFEQARPDLTSDTAVARFGEVTAFATPSRTMSMFNRVLCMTEPSRLDEVLAWYQAQAVVPRFEVCPLNADDALREALRARGFVHTPAASYCRRLFAKPAEIADLQETVEVRPVTNGDFDAWMRIDEAVFPGGVSELRRAQIWATFGEPRMHRFLAYVDGEPVGLGRAEIIDGIAMLNGAGTLPNYRGRGCQRSLAARRIRVIRELGCELITCLVGPDTDSERNLRRAGLKRHSDREPWLPRDFQES